MGRGDQQFNAVKLRFGTISRDVNRRIDRTTPATQATGADRPNQSQDDSTLAHRHSNSQAVDR